MVILSLFKPVKPTSKKDATWNFLKSENQRLKEANDSLNLLLKKNELIFDEMSLTILEMANQKREIKYVYNEKYKEIRFFTNSRIIMEFDSIFAKSNLRQR